MWIKYLADNTKKGVKAGEVVEMDDTAATALIENGIAEKAQEPASVVTKTTELEGSLKTFVLETAKQVAAETLQAIQKATPNEADRKFLTVADNGYEAGTAPKYYVPASAKRYGSLRNFKGANAEAKAASFGMWMLSLIGNGNSADVAEKYCREKLGIKYFAEQGDGKSFYEIRTKVSRENNNTSSGFLVPDQFENDLIDLREEYGVFRKLAKIVPMQSDTRSDPRRVGGLTAYFVGESTAPTASDKTWDRVRLTAKKTGVLTKYTRELNEDAVINIGDDLAGEIAYAFATLEDNCGINGDGTSTYGGIVGIRTKLDSVDGSGTDSAGLITATGHTSWSALTLSDFNSVVGALPQYAFKRGKVRWVVSQAFWGAVMQRLAMAAGGNRVTEIVDGVPQMYFAGFPVEVSQQMPTSSTSGSVCALFGAYELGARFGDRRMTSIRTSDVALNSFEQDEIAMVGFERFDIVVHDVGSSSVAGPICGLKVG